MTSIQLYTILISILGRKVFMVGILFMMTG